MERVVLYIDGFNFYYGVTNHWHKKGLAGLGWCDFRALVERHLGFVNSRLEIKYFTAPVEAQHETPSHRKDEHKRYSLWARAVRTIEGIRVIEGFHKTKTRSTSAADVEVLNVDSPAKGREEKQSDVNLAIEIMLDALGTSRPQRVYLLSDDQDLMPVVFALLERLPNPIEVVVVLPSRASAGTWQDNYHQTAARLSSLRLPGLDRNESPTVVSLTEDMLASSLLGYSLEDRDGQFECLDEWRLPPGYLDRHCGANAWRPDFH